MLQEGVLTTQRSHSEGEFIDPPPGTLLNQPPYLPGVPPGTLLSQPPGTLLNQPPYLPGVPPPQYSHLVAPQAAGGGGSAGIAAPLRTSKSAGEITFNGGGGGGREPGDVAHFGVYEPTVPKRKGKSRQRRDDLVSPGRTLFCLGAHGLIAA